MMSVTAEPRMAAKVLFEERVAECSLEAAEHDEGREHAA
jgi:hypothetical protein